MLAVPKIFFLFHLPTDIRLYGEARYLRGFPAVAEKEPLTDLQESRGFLRLVMLLVVDIRRGAGGRLPGWVPAPPPPPRAERGGLCEKYDEFIF